MASKILWLAGSAIFVFLGTVHFVYTFFTDKFNPRNNNVIGEMRNTSPRLTNETTLWKAWRGFNASHSIGAIFFGTINILLISKDFSIIADSFLISLLTILTSLFYLFLANKYWFSVPYLSIMLAVICFILSPVLSYLS